ncbi:hypothetical protein ASPZODRAFT_28726 [Penicilliopsis zonata CBS 506.65]|uniref:Uncharacterized protein n=1 Tax=Penicilliopsis zonata CBS 506.65 TaxID=1073090 RepID=A0A1L9S7L5_9EURO|nr:hypothetical protein ASPZODRAFT_28726 [Penicilliopsis zonata CBS 506.65]OJJ43153.1 hypothetical protein ASPZODRAFT_28726 [Penicilliopsis zonata CBS 506.65]
MPRISLSLFPSSSPFPLAFLTSTNNPPTGGLLQRLRESSSSSSTAGRKEFSLFWISMPVLPVLPDLTLSCASLDLTWSCLIAAISDRALLDPATTTPPR